MATPLKKSIIQFRYKSHTLGHLPYGGCPKGAFLLLVGVNGLEPLTSCV